MKFGEQIGLGPDFGLLGFLGLDLVNGPSLSLLLTGLTCCLLTFQWVSQSIPRVDRGLLLHSEQLVVFFIYQS